MVQESHLWGMVAPLEEMDPCGIGAIPSGGESWSL